MDFPATHKAPIQRLNVEVFDTGEYCRSSVKAFGTSVHTGYQGAHRGCYSSIDFLDALMY